MSGDSRTRTRPSSRSRPRTRPSGRLRPRTRPSEQSRRAQPSRRTRVALVLACCLVAALLVPVPVLAGDGTTIFEIEPHEIDAEPGETITIDVFVYERGNSHGNGIDELSVDLEYDADVLTATDVEHSSILAAGDEEATVESDADVDTEAGSVTVDQTREPSGDGAVVNDPVATITFEVGDEVEPTSAPIEITDATTSLVSSDYPRPTVERDGTIHVDGGGETTADEADDETATDSPEGVTVAEDAAIDSTDDTGDTGSTGDATDAESTDDAVDSGAETEPNDEDSIPGFGVLTAVSGVFGAFVVVIAARRFQR